MKQSKARGKVLLATDRLATEQPLHAGVLAQWRLVEDATIGTMAVGFHRGRLTLAFSPTFVESITLDELAAVLTHEANHVLFGHCTREPQLGEHKSAMTIAEEVTVNEWVAGPLPCDPIVLSNYPSLPSNEDTRARYDRLLAILPEQKDPLDDHSRWEQVWANGQLAGGVISAAIARVWEKMTPEQRVKVNLPQAIQKIVQEAVRSSGSAAIGSGMANVPWQQVLRRYVGRSLTRRPMFTRPPRRFPELVGILPGRGRSGSKPKVMAVIDSSGSMTAAILADISAELAVMARTYEVIVVEADDQVRDTYRYRPVLEVHGRGATDFRPALASPFLRQHRVDLVAYFTDGHGSAPSDPPAIPVVWCLTPRGKKPASWGRGSAHLRVIQAIVGLHASHFSVPNGIERVRQPRFWVQKRASGCHFRQERCTVMGEFGHTGEHGGVIVHRLVAMGLIQLSGWQLPPTNGRCRFVGHIRIH